jgi:hypothetical protein
MCVTLVFKFSIIDGTFFSLTAKQRGKYVSRFCVLLFLIIEKANVNGEFLKFIQSNENEISAPYLARSNFK